MCVCVYIYKYITSFSPRQGLEGLSVDGGSLPAGGLDALRAALPACAFDA